MERTLIKDLPSKIGETVKLKGWLQTLRDQKSMQFLILRDNTGLAQVAHWKKGNPELAEMISGIGTESALTLTGKVVENEIVKLGGIEIQLETITIENNAELPLPFEPFAETLPDMDYRQDWRYLDLRRERNRLIFEIQTTLEHAMREYFVEHGFIEMHSPKIMGTPSEGGAEVFHIDYFERDAFLAQSPQFFKQMAQAAGFEKVFEIGPVFRADPSFTSRHMTEFTGIDYEISWIDSHEDVMAFCENWLAHTYKVVKEKHGEQIKETFDVEIEVPQTPFPRLTMSEAYAILKEMNYKLPPEKKGDLDPGAERALGEYVKEKYGNDFVFVKDWPATVRAFYHMRHADQPLLTMSFDLIGKGLELTTGAQREHRYEVLKAQAIEKGLDTDLLQGYLDYFRYGCPPHGGLGLGLNRLLMVMLNLPSIRDAVYLFRGPNRLEP